MLVLLETAAGYAIFKVSTNIVKKHLWKYNLTFSTFQLLDDKKLSQSDNLYLDFQCPESASKV